MSRLPSLWEQFGDDIFLFQRDRASVHEARSLKTRRREPGVDEPDRSPDLNPMEQLWDELDWRPRARPRRHTSGKRSCWDVLQGRPREACFWICVVIPIVGMKLQRCWMCRSFFQLRYERRAFPGHRSTCKRLRRACGHTRHRLCTHTPERQQQTKWQT